ncbi:MAG: hypothetical protein IH621_15580 [Krumholzibacteria bacterium]|nr:hypothetical protein [Candidatus Krumholzibacteria bacterium]
MQITFPRRFPLNQFRSALLASCLVLAAGCGSDGDPVRNDATPADSAVFENAGQASSRVFLSGDVTIAPTFMVATADFFVSGGLGADAATGTSAAQSFRTLTRALAGETFEDPDEEGFTLTCTSSADAATYTSSCEGESEVLPGCTAAFTFDSVGTRSDDTYTVTSTTNITCAGE